MAEQAKSAGAYLYRGQSWKQRIKPLAVRVLSAAWLTYYKLRFGKRVRFGRNFITNGKLVVRGPGRVIFADDINAWCHAEKNVFITYSPDAVITVGKGARLSGASVQALKRIEIGPDCMVASCIIFDTDFHNPDPVLRHDPDAPVAVAPVRLVRNVWVGGQTAILKGVTVGENAVVAFRAVVTKDVPPNAIVAGNPARIIKYLDDLS